MALKRVGLVWLIDPFDTIWLLREPVWCGQLIPLAQYGSRKGRCSVAHWPFRYNMTLERASLAHLINLFGTIWLWRGLV